MLSWSELKFTNGMSEASFVKSISFFILCLLNFNSFFNFSFRLSQYGMLSWSELKFINGMSEASFVKLISFFMLCLLNFNSVFNFSFKSFLWFFTFFAFRFLHECSLMISFFILICFLLLSEINTEVVKVSR